MENCISTNEIQHYLVRKDRIELAFKNGGIVSEPQPFNCLHEDH